MGVPGLWETLNKVGKSTSLVHLAVRDGFEQNSSGRRGYRIGVDASIWFHHASFSKGGENPEMRGLFFRLIFFAKLPIIPLFVFDGRERPKIKRGSKLGKSGNHPRERGFKHLLDAFGMEWREARGEAEAELAYLNQLGHIDAILTDDCDALLFGARTIIKNISSKLSGNKGNLAKNSAEKADNHHTMVYNAVDIQADPTIALSRGGLILFALLAGGDYHKGVDKVGKKIAHGLARCDFSDELLNAYENLRNCKPELDQFLRRWRERVNLELKENKRGFLPHRTSLSLPDNFPDLEVLENYANPINSGSGRNGASTSLGLRDRRNLDLAKIAQLCEENFEWGYREKIIERFRNLLWPCAVMHILRRAALELDSKARDNEGIPGELLPIGWEVLGNQASLVQKYLGTVEREDRLADAFVNRGPSHGHRPAEVTGTSLLFKKVVGSRQHTSTDGLLEYRVEVSPAQLVQITNSGIKGTRKKPPGREGTKQPKKAVPEANEVLRLWIPASILALVYPSTITQFVDSHQSQRKGKGKAKANHQVESIESASEDDLPLAPTLQLKGDHQILDNGHKAGRAILEPWFLSDPPQKAHPINRECQGFFFTSPNPDLVEDLDDTPQLIDEEGFDGTYPSTQFDRFCDQILTAPIRESKKRSMFEGPHPQNTTNEHATKRAKTGSQLLDALDLLL
ncbi:hypothetical protein GALMADRAFT_249443 [Galerina marginata CBS 339.88]|uniref:XPG-I domain-containing protein n=1 Tax=Galerina marginata (strain CBS 339.88) TaxID=685588 RepID=A0A067T648_GALM3|nr:hypothetical protein GALMADRAFT_249443 [Galerina marginata CBS 339.88]